MQPDDQSPGDVEHERKFVVTDLEVVLRRQTGRREIIQGYLAQVGGWSVRIRLEWDEGEEDGEPLASATFKGPWDGISRPEVTKHDFPVTYARALIDICPGTVHKTRYWGMDGTWVADVFKKRNIGLVLAEIEGSRDEIARLEAPPWATREVTGIARYGNAELALRPYEEWTTEEKFGGER